MSFAKHASLVDERGRILFYKRLKACLIEAGASEDITQTQLAVLVDGLEIFEKSVEDPATVLDEVYLNFDQYVMLYDAYVELVSSGKFAALAEGKPGQPTPLSDVPDALLTKQPNDKEAAPPSASISTGVESQSDHAFGNTSEELGQYVGAAAALGSTSTGQQELLAPYSAAGGVLVPSSSLSSSKPMMVPSSQHILSTAGRPKNSPTSNQFGTADLEEIAIVEADKGSDDSP